MGNFGSLYERLFTAFCVASLLQLGLRLHDATELHWWNYVHVCAFILTVVSFLIGNANYLAWSYNQPAGRPALSKIAGDALLLILHGACLFALARATNDARHFNLALIALAFADAPWLLYDAQARPLLTQGPSIPSDRNQLFYAPRVWLSINASFGLMLIIARLATGDPSLLTLLSTGLAFANRLCDFVWTRFGYRAV